jgi:hypothetical protein
MIRYAPMIAVLLFVAGAAAQAGNCIPWPTSRQQCDNGPAAQRVPVETLIWSDTDLFRRRPDGSVRMRRVRPLFRPFLDHRYEWNRP